VFDGIGMMFYFSLVIIGFVLFRSRNRLREFRIKLNKTRENGRIKPTHQYKKRSSVDSERKAIAGDSQKA
jgi:hypothetical protein